MLILTHPGSSHKDDLLACAVLAHLHGAPIVRRDPTAEDLADPDTFVVDVGGEHAPERNNFDHHQFPRDHPPVCALSLVLQHLEIYEDARQFCDWLETAEILDTRGPVEACRWLNIERGVLGKLNSPIDITLLRRFAGQSEIHPGDPLHTVLSWVGEDIVRYVRGLRERLDTLARQVVTWELDGFSAAFLARTDPMPDEPSSGLARHVDASDPDGKIVAMIYPDRRGEGYGLGRHNDDRRLDYTRIADEPDVHFAHARGFVAKTSATDPERLKALVLQAFVDT